jgi:hypothetical protein
MASGVGAVRGVAPRLEDSLQLGIPAIRGRETRVSGSATSRYLFIVVDGPGSEKPEPDAQTGPLVPHPSPLFWRQAWTKFQRALDPLALPKPLPQWHKDRTSDGSRRRLRGRG